MAKKSKVANVILVSVLVFSILTVGVSMLSQIVSAQYVQPNVTRVNIQASGDQISTNVAGAFKNNEAVDVYGVATAVVTLSNTPGDSLTASSDRTLIKAGETVWITVNVHVPFEPYHAHVITFVAEPISAPVGTGSQTTIPSYGGTGQTGGNTPSKGFNFASVAFPIVGIVVVALGSIGGFVMFKKTRLSEQKVRRFTSYEYQDWVLQRLGARAGSALDSRKGIDGFTGENLPVSIKQSDSVDRLQVDLFMNALAQTKIRRGVMIAFGFNSEANAAVSRASMNRIEIKLVTIKELIGHRESIL